MQSKIKRFNLIAMIIYKLSSPFKNEEALCARKDAVVLKGAEILHPIITLKHRNITRVCINS